MATERKKEMESNRRRWSRLNPSDVPFLKKVELSQGYQAEIVNISRGGVLLETEERLRPNCKIMFKLVTTEGVLRMEGYIIRSSIHSLKEGPRYRTAIAFREQFDMLDEVANIPTEQSGDKLSESAASNNIDGSDGSTPPQVSPDGDLEKSLPILTLVASDEQGVCLEESFALNNW